MAFFARLMNALAACAHAYYIDPVGPSAPWGMHIAYGSNGMSSVTIMWSTRNSVSASVVQAGPISGAPYSNWPIVGEGEVIPFSDVGNTQTIHRVRLSGLAPSTTYAYICGDGSSNVSPVFNFTTQSASPDWVPVFGIYGDMGISQNAMSTMPLLVDDVRSGALDVILHIGDAAYDLQSNQGATGDAFMVQIQEVAAYVPYHLCPGNHEDATDFYEYRMRLGAGMPAASPSPSSGGNGTFHSFNAGPVHVVMVSSEVYMSVQPHSAGLMIEQAEWLEADLAAVNRSATPFVILGLHQPFYCSPNDDQDDCHQLLSLVRMGLEKIIYEGGVDMVFGAHEHAYERNYPVYDFAWNSSNLGPGAYVDYTAPIHILSGAAGCPENEDGWQKKANPFSALRVNDYGYGRLHVVNRTALLWEYVDNVAGKVLDSITVVKSSFGPAFPPKTAAAWRAAH